MILISDATTVQLWLNGVESFNTKEEPGIERHCFNQLFNADDEIRIQVSSDGVSHMILKVYDIDDVELLSANFDQPISGVFDYTLIPEDEGITNQKIKFKIFEATLDEWTSQTSSANNEWTAICYAEALGLYAAVAQTGTGSRVMTSPDGENWTTRVSAEDNEFRSICFSESLGLFVAVAQTGAANRVMTSPDGIVWTAVSVSAKAWQDVIWVEDDLQFIAVASSGASNTWAMTSPDGATWTLQAIGAQTWQSITHSSELGLYVAVAGTGTLANNIRTSPDGVTWTYRTAPATGWADVVWTGTRFVAVGQQGVMYSDDGETWIAGTEAIDKDWTGLDYKNGFLVAVAITGESMISTDHGKTWIELETPNSNQWSSVVAGPDKFVAVSLNGSGNRVMTIDLTDAEEVAYSDLVSIKVSHAKTKLIRFSNATDYAGLIYQGISPVPNFSIRIEAKFFEEIDPEENEKEELSDGSVVKLLGTVKIQKLLEVMPAPFYMHRKLKYILQHNTIYIDNLAWVKEDNYEVKEASDKHDPFREATAWLTQKDNSYTTNPFS